MDFVKQIVNLYKKTATQLPEDVEKLIQDGLAKEDDGSVSKKTLEAILENIKLAKEENKPICQDTGTPIFFIKYGKNYTQQELKNAVVEATKIATKEVPLRPNAVFVVSGKNSGDNVAGEIPVIYFEEWDDDKLEISLILKGGGSENVGMSYKLPDSDLEAGRDLKGVEKCVVDAVIKAQGKGCPPYIVSVVIGSPKDLLAVEAKKQLLRSLDSENPDAKLAEMENSLNKKINSLGIGPIGFGGNTTALKTFIKACGRHPASYFVEVSFLCWAARRNKILI